MQWSKVIHKMPFLLYLNNYVNSFTQKGFQYIFLVMKQFRRPIKNIESKFKS